MNDDFDRIKDALPLIQYVQRQGLEVKRQGAHHKTLCIFHDDHNPSLVLYGDGGFKCFTCGATGDVIDFAMKLHNWTKADALKELATCAGITLTPLTGAAKQTADKRERLYALLQDASTFYYAVLFQDVGQEALQYVRDKRGLSLEILAAAQIGYASWYGKHLYRELSPKGYSDDELLKSGLCKRSEKGDMYDFFRNRIVIPLRDHKGRIVAFSGRALNADDKPRYLWNPMTEIFNRSASIYWPTSRVKNGQGATQTLSMVTVIVEGQFDALQAHSRGVSNVCAQMGSSLSDEQLTLLCSSDVERLVFCLDNDAAGEIALRRLVEKHIHTAADKGVSLYAMQAPYGKDADDTLREHPEMWQPAVDAARPVVEVLIERELAKHGDTITGVQKSNTARALLPILKSANPFIQQDNLATLSRYTGVSVEDLTAWLNRQPLRVMDKAPAFKAQTPNLPSLELVVLHGLIVNEDPQRWLDRANAVFSLMPFPKACGPLSQNDFTDERTRGVMAMITTAVSNGNRPFDTEVQTQIGNGLLHEAFYRAWKCPEIQSVFASHDARPVFTLDYSDFIRHVCRLRYLRVDADIKHRRISGIDLVEWTRAKLYLWGMMTSKGVHV